MCVLYRVWLGILIMLTRNQPPRVVWSIFWRHPPPHLPRAQRLIWRTPTSTVPCVLLPSTIPRWLCSTTMDASTRGIRPDRRCSESSETMTNKVTQGPASQQSGIIQRESDPAGIILKLNSCTLWYWVYFKRQYCCEEYYFLGHVCPLLDTQYVCVFWSAWDAKWQIK